MSLVVGARRVLVGTVLAVLLAGCGSDPAPIPLGPAPTAAASGGLAPSDRPSVFAEPAFTDAAALFAAVDAAVAGHSSVHQEMSAPGQSPAAYLDQEYGEAGTDLRLYVDLGLLGAMGSFVLYRIDGLVYGADGAGPRPMPTGDGDDEDAGGTASHMLRSDVQQDFRRMAPVASALELVGEEEVNGVATRHYRLLVTLTGEDNPAITPTTVTGAAPTDLWLGADHLPVRIDVAYGETGTSFSDSLVSRAEYAAWSAPVDFDPADLDWSAGR